jgi:hypothetical protein
VHCPACKAQLAELESNAEFASRAIALLQPADIRQNPAAMLQGSSEVSREPIRRTGFWNGRVRLGLGAAAALAVMLVTALTPQGQSAAAQFLAQFRSQRLAIVSIDPTQTRLQLPELNRLAIVKGDTRARPEPVSSIAEATQRAGFDVRVPPDTALPATLNSEPRISVLKPNEVRFTFDRARAAEYFKSINRSELQLPDRINGTTLLVDVPAVAVLEYSSTNRNDLGMFVAQAGEVHAGTEGGASLEDLRDYLLTLPTLSESTVRQLRALSDWRTTLPIPVPVEQVLWQQTTVNGVPGYVFANRNGLGGAMIWNSSGRIYGVAGATTQAELERVATSLR